MKQLSTKVINDLFEKNAEGLVSIYMPTHRRSTPPNMQEDQTRFKNLIREAAEQLAEQQIEEGRIESFKSELLGYLDNREFWQDLHESLAIFASADKVSMYRLPIEVEEWVFIGNRFDITPLLIIQEMNRPFYVFALAMQSPVLYKGNMIELKQVDIDFPKSVEDALNIDEMFANSKTIRGHEGTGGTSHAIGPHGQGDSTEAGKEERLQYFRIIEHKLRDYDKLDLTAPLILAATDSEGGDFLATTNLPNVVPEFIRGNYTKVDRSELHSHALEMMRSHVLTKDLAKLTDYYQEQKGVNRSSSDPEDIEMAAKAGRIDTLLVDVLDVTNDSVRDVQQAILKLRYQRDYNLKRLLDLVQVVVKNGGRVVGLQTKLMPDGAPVAALYRY